MRIQRYRDYCGIQFLCKTEGINTHYFMHCCAKSKNNVVY